MRVLLPSAGQPNQRWAMDFVADRLVDGPRFRVLTVVDLFSRECLALYAEGSITGRQVVAELAAVVARRGAPETITVDNGPEFCSRAMEAWSEAAGVELASSRRAGRSATSRASTGGWETSV